MRNFTLLVATSFLAISTFATTYTWTGGGASGKWDDVGNWGAAGWPTGGDTANLESAVTITSDFELGAGELTIVASADLTFDCVVSGAGGINKQGAGHLILKKDNTFSGGFQCTGASAKLSGSVDIYAGGALGTATAYIDKTGQTGPRLNVYGPMSVTTPVSFGADYGNSQGTLWTTNDVTFAGKVFPASRFRLSTAGGGATVTFNEMNTGYGNWMPQVGKDDTLVFNEVVKFSSGCDIYSATAGGNHNGGHVVFKAPGNDWMFFHVGSDAFVFEAENGLPARYKKFNFESNNARIDIAGCNQKVTYVETSFSAPATYSNFGFTNSSETAAIVSFEDFSTGLKDFTFSGQFFGKTGFKWAPASSEATFTVNGRSQPTTGDLIVSNGTVALTGGATFTSLARLTVGATGVLSFDETSGAEMKADELVLEEGAALRTGAKTTLTVNSASTNGVPLESNTYSADSLPGFVTGPGLILVKGFPSEARTWTGSAGNGLWSDGANWSGGTKPAAGEDVIVQGAEVTLDEPTAQLRSLYVADGATVTVHGWETKIEAMSVNLIGGGVLTCAGRFETEETASRVWIVCTDLQVGVDSRIDLDGKGYAPKASDTGYGPGGGSYRFGASHGGPGGANVGSGALFGKCYDDPADPSMPGSGGYWETRYATYGVTGNAGGGVLKVEATGTVSVYGIISADGESAFLARKGGSYNDTAGSGGAICIDCARFVAKNGKVTAKGGEGDSAVNPSWQLANGGFGQPGGGGMIAIRHGGGQTVGDVENAEISAACGLYTGASVPVTLANQDIYWSNADLGSVWFTDGTIVEATLGKGLSGRIVHPSGFATDGDLTIFDGYVRFEGEGVSVSVGGDLTIAGSYARLEVGGVCYTNRSAASDLYCGETPVSVSVGGNLTVSDGGRFDLRAAATNGVDRFGATATVDGSLTVGAGSWLVAWCDVRNTGAPAFEVGGNFSVAAGGVVSASRRGGAGGWNGGLYSNSNIGTCDHGFGLGAGRRNAAGSYGGRGGVGKNKSVAKTNSYGSEFYPSFPGSGGGAASHGMAGSGGGLVFVKAAGEITVDGLVEADGGYSYYIGADAINNVSAGSGGAIFLSGRTFSGSGQLSAKGGNAMVDWYTPTGASEPVWLCSGAGGGGRIAVWTGEPVDESVRPTSYRVTSDTVPIAGEGGFSGTTGVAGGSPVYRREASEAQRVPLDEASVGEVGTVKFCKLNPRQGFLLLVR